jgi:hypothetical protein
MTKIPTEFETECGARLLRKQGIRHDCSIELSAPSRDSTVEPRSQTGSAYTGVLDTGMKRNIMREAFLLRLRWYPDFLSS